MIINRFVNDALDDRSDCGVTGLTLVVVQPNRHVTAIENLSEKIDMVILAGYISLGL